jgi:cation/acetate symporter
MIVGSLTAIGLVMVSPNMTYPKAVIASANKVLNGEPAVPAKEATPAVERSSFMCELFALEGCVLAKPAQPASPAKPAKPGAAEKLAGLNAKLQPLEASLPTITDVTAKATAEADVAKLKKDIAAVEKAKAKAEADLAKFEGQTTSIMGLEKPFFLLKNPGLISIPLGFLLVILGSLFTRDKRAEEMWDELYVRQNTGINAEAASAH